jgi:predicted peptidase
MRADTLIGLALLIAGCSSADTAPEPLAEGSFERRMETAVEGQQLKYLLDVPATAGMPEEGWPLLLFLHGAGERGDDFDLLRVHGPPKLTGEIPELSRCVLVSPQCPLEDWWKAKTLRALVDEVRGLVDIDDSRLYVSGLSMGGYGTWALLASYPDLFAAAVPICGGGDISRLWPQFAGDFELDGLLRARDVPIRVYHGADDTLVPPEESRILVNALNEIGADVELTVYSGVGHDSWVRTYTDRDMYAWLFAQRR